MKSYHLEGHKSSLPCAQCCGHTVSADNQEDKLLKLYSYIFSTCLSSTKRFIGISCIFHEVIVTVVEGSTRVHYSSLSMGIMMMLVVSCFIQGVMMVQYSTFCSPSMVESCCSKRCQS